MKKKRHSIQRQLWMMLEGIEERETMATVLGCLKVQCQEDLCYALVAFIKYGIGRKFENPFMQTVFNMLTGRYSANEERNETEQIIIEDI